jgi:redox-sensitive bicupin YhaK (pirin superfamily)
MTGIRKIAQIMKSTPTIEGAGVNLKRAFGHAEVPLLDPFLLLDDFHSDNPEEYLAGFPWHPHRGIETVTYVLKGKVEHGDSIGNRGVIQPGDVQWMTAGSGIIHQEMPKGTQGIWGFQLWVNLPSSQKMMEPRYRGIIADQIPEVHPEHGVTIKVISGEVDSIKGPVEDLVVAIEYLDISMAPHSVFEHPIKRDNKAFSYVIDGSGYFEPEQENPIEIENMVILEDGDSVTVEAGENGLRYLLISGEPIGEPVAWYGPIVMNTKEELELAFKEFREGAFIKQQ